MKLKYRALLFNFLGFAILFLIARFSLGYFFDINRFYLAAVSAVIATLLAPKFAVIKSVDGEKLLMKWIFRKGTKEI